MKIPVFKTNMTAALRPCLRTKLICKFDTCNWMGATGKLADTADLKCVGGTTLRMFGLPSFGKTLFCIKRMLQNFCYYWDCPVFEFLKLCTKTCNSGDIFRPYSRVVDKGHIGRGLGGHYCHRATILSQWCLAANDQKQLFIKEDHWIFIML